MLNSVTIHAMRKTSSLPKPLKTLLLSLAVSDLGVGLIAQPLHITVYVMEMEQNSKNSLSNKTTYIAYITSLNVFTFASFFGVTALSADRFLGIRLNLRYQELVTPKRVLVVVITMWASSAFLSLIRWLIPRNVIYAVFIIVYVSCILTATTLNYKIYKAVRHHANQIQALQVQQEAQNGEMENAARVRKFADGTFLVYLAFLVCYLTDVCFLVVVAIHGPNTNTKGLQIYAATLMFLNSSLNPLIYSWKMRQIRHTVVNMLRNLSRRFF